MLDMTDMMDGSHDSRGTGLTRAKSIERLTLWLGLPLLLALLCLTAGVVNYSPVQKSEAISRTRPAPPSPAESAPSALPMHMRPVPVTPSEPVEGATGSLQIDEVPNLS